jgi:chorismate--pyruvate lyase
MVTMQNNRQSAIDEPDWLRPETIAASDRPGGLWAWLTECGSLTERLRRACWNRFNVQVIREREMQLDVAGALVNESTGACRMREVYLCCGDTPWVYACTVMPQSLLAAANRHWLHELGSHALGDALTARGGIRRSQLAVAKVDSRHSLFHAAVADLSHPPEALWARRSVVAVENGSLLIRECFLPEAGLSLGSATL